MPSFASMSFPKTFLVLLSISAFFIPSTTFLYDDAVSINGSFAMLVSSEHISPRMSSTYKSNVSLLAR